MTASALLSAPMHEVLAAASALGTDGHATLRDLVDLVAVELVYKLRDLTTAR